MIFPPAGAAPHVLLHDLHGARPQRRHVLRRAGLHDLRLSGTNCIKIGLPGKLILSKRNGLWEVLFS